MALEAALKLKEVAGLHAEGFSAAEFLHGPQALLEPGFPVLALVQKDEALEGVLATLGGLKARGAHLLVLSPEPEALALADTPLRLPVALAPEFTPLLLAQGFYPLAEALARARGLDPDRPRHLTKVTAPAKRLRLGFAAWDDRTGARRGFWGAPTAAKAAVGYLKDLAPRGTSRSGARRTTRPAPSGTPRTSTSEGNPPMTRVPRFTAATTRRPSRSSGR